MGRPVVEDGINRPVSASPRALEAGPRARHAAKGYAAPGGRERLAVCCAGGWAIFPILKKVKRRSPGRGSCESAGGSRQWTTAAAVDVEKGPLGRVVHDPRPGAGPGPAGDAGRRRGARRRRRDPRKLPTGAYSRAGRADDSPICAARGRSRGSLRHPETTAGLLGTAAHRPPNWHGGIFRNMHPMGTVVRADPAGTGEGVRPRMRRSPRRALRGARSKISIRGPSGPRAGQRRCNALDRPRRGPAARAKPPPRFCAVHGSSPFGSWREYAARGGQARGEGFAENRFFFASLAEPMRTDKNTSTDGTAVADGGLRQGSGGPRKPTRSTVRALQQRLIQIPCGSSAGGLSGDRRIRIFSDVPALERAVGNGGAPEGAWTNSHDATRRDRQRTPDRSWATSRSMFHGEGPTQNDLKREAILRRLAGRARAESDDPAVGSVGAFGARAVHLPKAPAAGPSISRVFSR